MLRDYVVVFNSRGVIEKYDNLPPAVQKAAQRAVNRAADRTRTESARRVRRELNFPASYVAPSEGRLSVSKYANEGLTAKITARNRGTSLARFVASRRSSKGSEPGVRVIVKPGVARFMKGAFLVKLKGVGGNTDTQANLGLAIRTRNGLPPDNAYAPVRTRAGFWLLYGPSVAQALYNSRKSGIWPDQTPDIKALFETEFFRQLELQDVL